MVKLLHLLGIVNGIYLEDMDGDIYKSWIRKSPVSGNLTAHVYPFAKVGRVKLNQDGTVSNHYVEKWRRM